MEKEVVEELIQAELTSGNLKAELNMILPGSDKREVVLRNYQELKSRLGEGGASSKAADEIIRFLTLPE